MIRGVFNKTAELTNHPLYERLSVIGHVGVFSQFQVFCVHFYSKLLEAAGTLARSEAHPQLKSDLPFQVSSVMRDIVSSESSLIDIEGRLCTRSDLYELVLLHLGVPGPSKHDFKHSSGEYLPKPVRQYVDYHNEILEDSDILKAAGVFFLANFSLVPLVYAEIIRYIPHFDCPLYSDFLHLYSQRDSEGPADLSHILIDEVASAMNRSTEAAYQAAYGALCLRKNLWDYVLELIESKPSQHKSIPSNPEGVTIQSAGKNRF